MDKIFKKMSANGTIQYHGNENKKSRHLPDTTKVSSYNNVDVTTKEEQSRNENFTKMINTHKTSLQYTNPNYKRNDFRQSYENTKENSVEESTRIRKLIGKRESFYYNSTSSSSIKDLNRFQKRNMTPPITNFKSNATSSSNSSSPQQQQQQQSQQPNPSQFPPHPHQLQYGAAIYQPTGNIQQMYPPTYQGYIHAANNSESNENSSNQQQMSTRGSGRGGGMNRRGGRGRGGNSNNANNGMNSRREYRQNNNQQSSHPNSMNANEYIMDHQAAVSPYVSPAVYFHYPSYAIPGSAISTTATAQNLTGQPLFAAVQQPPYFIQPYGAYPFVYNYNLMTPQMPPMQTEVIDGDQNQDANAPPAAVYQPIPYHIAAYPDQHHLFTDHPQIANTDRLEFHGSIPGDEDYQQLHMIGNAGDFDQDPNEVPIIENHGEIVDAQLVADYHHPHHQIHHGHIDENEIQNNNQLLVVNQHDVDGLIEKTRDLIVNMQPMEIKESPLPPQQYLDEKLDDSNSLQFTNHNIINNNNNINNESNELKITIESTQQQQQQPPQIRKQTSSVPISSNQTNVIKKQTASVSVSAIPNKHYEEVKMNEYANDTQHQHQQTLENTSSYVSSHQQQQQQQQNQINKNSFSSIASSKHSPKSWKDEKKTEIRQNDSQQRTSLSEQAKQQIATTISNNSDTLSSSSSTSLKKDKMETAGTQVSPKQHHQQQQQQPSEKESTKMTSPTTLEKNAQIAKQSNSVPPSSWAGLFVSETSSTTQQPLSSSMRNSQQQQHQQQNQQISTTTSNSSSNQINKKSTSDVSSSTSSQSNNNKLPGTMSYSAVSAQSIAIQSTPPPPQSANNNKIIKPNTTSTATSTSSSTNATTNNNDVASHSSIMNNVSLKTTTPVDQNALKLGDFYSKYKIDYGSVSLMPRGLLNKSNYCYINAILQALVACPPFYHLMKSIPSTPIYYKSDSKSPVTDAMVELVSNFSTSKKYIQREKSRSEVQDIPRDTSFEPKPILKMLQKLRNDIFPIEGRQEDAEEFLSFILNKMNDEMIEMKKLVEKSVTKSKEETDDLNGNLETSEDEEEWQVISGTRNKSTITRTTDYGRSPISDIFGGKLRLRVHREGDHSSDNIEPFFTLKLVIERASSVREALDLLVGKDQLEGFTCAKTNQEITAWQQVTIEELPVVLILHLKCFDFKKEGCTKIMKTVEFPIELKIDQKLLASKVKYQAKQKQYKLFAVVYHDGKDASKGHYVSDIWNGANSTWVRYDDASVKPVSDHAVLHPKTQNHHRVPYLLFYRRHDTIGGKKQGA